MRHKQAMTFEIQDSSVKLYYNKQCIVFNSYNAYSRQSFNRFRKTLTNSPKDRYDNLNDVFRLARVCNIKATSGGYGVEMTVHKNIAY